LEGANGWLGFRSGARGEHPWHQHSREGHGWRRPWGGRRGSPLRVTGKTGKKGIRRMADGWGPHVSETMRGRWAGGFGGLKGQVGWRFSEPEREIGGGLENFGN
jgi:hypothetical protein